MESVDVVYGNLLTFCMFSRAAIQSLFKQIASSFKFLPTLEQCIKVGVLAVLTEREVDCMLTYLLMNLVR